MERNTTYFLLLFLSQRTYSNHIWFVCGNETTVLEYCMGRGRQISPTSRVGHSKCCTRVLPLLSARCTFSLSLMSALCVRALIEGGNQGRRHRRSLHATHKTPSRIDVCS